MNSINLCLLFLCSFSASLRALSEDIAFQLTFHSSLHDRKEEVFPKKEKQKIFTNEGFLEQGGVQFFDRDKPWSSLDALLKELLKSSGYEALAADEEYKKFAFFIRKTNQNGYITIDERFKSLDQIGSDVYLSITVVPLDASFKFVLNNDGKIAMEKKTGSAPSVHLTDDNESTKQTTSTGFYEQYKKTIWGSIIFLAIGLGLSATAEVLYNKEDKKRPGTAKGDNEKEGER